jgi:signal transduction histidine kinase
MPADECVRATLEAVLDAMPSGVMIVEGPDGRVRYANRQAAAIFRTTPKELHHPSTYRQHRAYRLDGTLVATEDLPLVRALTLGDVATGVELGYDSAKGTRAFFRINAAPICDHGGRIVAAVCGFEDITAEIESARQREQSERFRELFLAMLGHDLRSPLSAIAFGARLLAQRGALGPEDARVVARIVAASDRMRCMIEQILDLARCRSQSGIPILPRPTNLHELVTRIVDELEPACGGRALRVRLEGDPHGVWDPDRLGQVVSNLVGNALEHTASDAAVEIRVERASGAARVTVHNTGAPIPGDVLPTLFDPFRSRAEQRSGTGASGKGRRGLGLGLYIARQIVAAHGGAIEVASEDGAGTTFTVTLPPVAPVAVSPVRSRANDA